MTEAEAKLLLWPGVEFWYWGTARKWGFYKITERNADKMKAIYNWGGTVTPTSSFTLSLDHHRLYLQKPETDPNE